MPTSILQHDNHHTFDLASFNAIFTPGTLLRVFTKDYENCDVHLCFQKDVFMCVLKHTLGFSFKEKSPSNIFKKLESRPFGVKGHDMNICIYVYIYIHMYMYIYIYICIYII